VWRSSGERVIDALGVHDGERKVHLVVVDQLRDAGEPIAEAADLIHCLG
jgi:hypothetical protein